MSSKFVKSYEYNLFFLYLLLLIQDEYSSIIPLKKVNSFQRSFLLAYNQNFQATQQANTDSIDEILDFKRKISGINNIKK